MRKIKTILFTILMSNILNAQNSADVTGLYNLGSTSPEGGSYLIVLENGDYAITYFGGIQTGKWKKMEGNMYKFTPNLRESTFQLFGRHNKDLQGKTKIYFNGGFENSETLIQVKTKNEEKNCMQRVFNEGANCFSYPYIHTYNSIVGSISFMSIPYGNQNPKHLIITIANPNGYNDFVAKFIKVDEYEAQSFIAYFEGNSLIINHYDYSVSKRESLSEVGVEDIEFLKKFIKNETNQNIIYLNPAYNTFGQMDNVSEFQQYIQEHHVYNKKKNAYIDPKNYDESIDYGDPETSYDDMSIIYAYERLKDISKKYDNFIINKNSLFQVSCD